MPELAANSRADVHALSGLAAGTRYAFEFAISDQQMTAFAELAGDCNPLHVDREFARARGYAGPVVYGGLLIAQVSRMIGMHLPGRDAIWTRLEIDFRAPLYVGEVARIEAEVSHCSEAVRALELSIRIVRGSQVLAQGEASVSLSQ